MIAFGSRLFFSLKTTTRNKGSLTLGAQKLLHPLEIVGFFVPFAGDDDDDGVRRWFDVVFETPAELDSELMYFFVVRSREIGNWKLLRLISHSQSRLDARNRSSRRESFVSKFAHKTTCSFH